ncbi:50S ribosomal protein L25 [Oceanidesulfovibrio indonesiensis]|uniref:Large ribosomal subunit protein bL25 n=1 Tax=Oceanidesulfovibrio indonesiensis TaxID=54767 RepID=A0A7M3MH48_9BACT|nr:50S ribosomal protein L25 [Oceanidesulfovibrio indonesiensis]TVM18380.1 50S ribosomal protein L25 [Oceanidesulfovibrio indonesiensis]
MAKKEYVVQVATRENAGKGFSRRLREEGKIPGVFYNGKGENFSVIIDEIVLTKTLRDMGRTQVFTMKIDKDGNTETIPAIIWQVQHHPYKKKLVHVDFYGIDPNKKIRVDVPIDLQGTPPGRKEGGILEVFHDSITVECLPMDIPQTIPIDVSSLQVGMNIHIEDLEFPENVEPFYEENFTILNLTAKRGLAATGEAGGGEEGGETAAGEAQGEGAAAEESE